MSGKILPRIVRLACVWSALAAALSAPGAPAATVALEAQAALHAGPGGGLSGMLVAGTPVELLEREGPWVRVRVEGWVLAEAAGAASAAPAPAAATPPAPAPAAVSAPAAVAVPAPAAVAAPAAPGGGRIEGTISFKVKRGRKTSGAAGAQVWLLPAAARAELERELSGSTAAEDAAQLAALEAEIVDLKRRADHVLQQESSFTEATRKSDALLASRDEVLEQRGQLLAATHGRHEALVRRAALESAVADARGWFSFSGHAPGPYAIYSRLVGEGLDVEWIENVELPADGAVRLDLDQERARGRLPEPS